MNLQLQCTCANFLIRHQKGNLLMLNGLFPSLLLASFYQKTFYAFIGSSARSEKVIEVYEIFCVLPIRE